MSATVLAAGVDTWSPAWYVGESSPAARALASLATVPSKRSQLIPEPIDGHRVGWFPDSGLAFAEGRPGGDTLASPDELPEALCRLESAMWDFGVTVEPARTRTKMRGRLALWDGPPGAGFAGLRRLDSTVDLALDDGAEGLSVLAGVASLLRASAGGQAQVIFQNGGRGAVETVYWRGSSGKRVLGRWYDKGVESGRAPRGQLIRPEDQRRYAKESRRSVEELTSSYVRSQFQRRFAPLWRASKGVTVGSVDRLAEQLRTRLETGRLTYGEAERLGGALLLQRVPEDSLPPEARASRRTRYRRQAQLRDEGLVLADGVLDDVEVDLHEVLGEVMESDAWGRRG